MIIIVVVVVRTISYFYNSNLRQFLTIFLSLFRVDPDMPEYEQPKFIVFYWKLVSLFTMFCFKCKEGGPSVTMKSLRTMVAVTQHCLKCKQSYEWQSQPTVHGKIPAGNLLLSFAILMAGASISKTLLIFCHIGLSVYTARTYFRHQRDFIFPIVLHYWEIYRANLVKKLKTLKDVVWTGDGRFDSMGHSAKYGSYNMLCTTIMKTVHFDVVEVLFEIILLFLSLCFPTISITTSLSKKMLNMIILAPTAT